MTVYFGDCRDALRQMIQDGVRVQMCVTSPPYWGLRDYGVEGQLGLEQVHDCLGWATGNPCGECHVCHMVEVFRLVREVLADDGTCWVNYGDGYTSAGGAGWQGKNGQRAHRTHTQQNLKKKSAVGGLKSKDLIGMPWRVALALQADGWYLRQDIIWHKPNPMPESVTDRCTKAHEYIFLLSKSDRYYYDAQAIKEPVSGGAHARRANNGVGFGHGSFPGHLPGNKTHKSVTAYENGAEEHRTKSGLVKYADKMRKVADAGSGIKNNRSMDESLAVMPDIRNKRSVWTVPTQPYKEAHFATFPPALIEPCILAGSRPGDTVLDPFFGSGTTGQVAENLGREWIGCELNRDYEPLQLARTAQRGLLI